jgi:hypothetical protein
MARRVICGMSAIWSRVDDFVADQRESALCSYTLGTS